MALSTLCKSCCLICEDFVYREGVVHLSQGYFIWPNPCHSIRLSAGLNHRDWPADILSFIQSDSIAFVSHPDRVGWSIGELSNELWFGQNRHCCPIADGGGVIQFQRRRDRPRVQHVFLRDRLPNMRLRIVKSVLMVLHSDSCEVLFIASVLRHM